MNLSPLPPPMILPRIWYAVASRLMIKNKNPFLFIFPFILIVHRLPSRRRTTSFTPPHHCRRLYHRRRYHRHSASTAPSSDWSRSKASVHVSIASFDPSRRWRRRKTLSSTSSPKVPPRRRRNVRQQQQRRPPPTIRTPLAPAVSVAAAAPFTFSLYHSILISNPYPTFFPSFSRRRLPPSPRSERR